MGRRAVCRVRCERVRRKACEVEKDANATRSREYSPCVMWDCELHEDRFNGLGASLDVKTSTLSPAKHMI